MNAVFLLCATILVAFQCATADPIGNCPSGNRPEGVDYLVDSHECSVFYKCDNGKPVKYTCPTNLHFNRGLNRCDWPSEAKCNWCDGSTTTTDCGCDTPTTTTPEPPCDTTTPACETTTLPCETTTLPCETTTLPCETTTPPCETTTLPCETTTLPCETTTLPCETTTLPCETTTLPCETTTLPCETTTLPCETTTPPCETTPKPCDTTTTSKPPCNDCPDEKCPQEDCYYSVYYAHPKSCGRYCQCDNGKAQDMPCPAGLHFNTKENVCDWPSNANCKL